MKRPMLYLAICLTILSFVSFYFVETAWIISIGLIFVSIACLFSNSVYNIFVIALVVFIFTTSAINEKKITSRMDTYSNKYATFELVATENSKRSNNYNSVTVKCVKDNNYSQNKKLILTYYGNLKIESGEKFVARVRISSLKHSQSKDTYFSNGIYSRLILQEYMYKTGEVSFYKRVQKYRDYITDTLKASLSQESAATMCGITIGNKEFFTDSFSENVKTSGVSHVMVVSGLHLSIILGNLFILFEKLIYNKYLKLFLSFGAVFFLVAVCGFTMSATRAGIMFIISALAPVLKRDYDLLSSLSFAVILILSFSPFAILGLSLQLSVLATLGIIVVSPFLTELIIGNFHVKNVFVIAIIKTILTTLSATILTLPITVARFGLISVVSPITNLLITYPVTIALILTCVAVAFSIIPIFNILSIIIFHFLDLLVAFINYCINFCGKLSFSTVDISTDSAYIFALFPLIIFIIIYTCKKRGLLVQSNKIKKGEG